MTIGRILIAGALGAALLLPGSPSTAGQTVGMEWWIGGGFVNADYYHEPIAVLRGGAGAVVLERFTIGANLQADREHQFGFGYVGLILPAIRSVEPYGRFHFGRRDDIDDTALGWTGGFRYGERALKIYLEAFGVIEPGYGTGACFGITF